MTSNTRLTRASFADALERSPLFRIVAIATRHGPQARYVDSYRSRLSESMHEADLDRAVAAAVVAVEHAVGTDHPDYRLAVSIARDAGCGDWLIVEAASAMAA